jgi:phosphatidylglycerophosphate synthase
VPRFSNSVLTKRNLAILIIALILAIGFLLLRAERAAAQITGDDYQSAVTLERLMILGMLGLVVLTWFYLKWRPPPDQEEETRIEPDRD